VRESLSTEQKLALGFLNLVRLERHHQRDKGYTSGHDDCHINGEIARMAIAYASPIDVDGGFGTEMLAIGKFVAGEDEFEGVWPWGDEPESLYSADRMDKLIIAGALLFAEWDRLRRAHERAAKKAEAQ